MVAIRIPAKTAINPKTRSSVIGSPMSGVASSAAAIGPSRRDQRVERHRTQLLAHQVVEHLEPAVPAACRGSVRYGPARTPLYGRSACPAAALQKLNRPAGLSAVVDTVIVPTCAQLCCNTWGDVFSMPKFSTRDADLVQVCLLACNTHREITVTYDGPAGPVTITGIVSTVIRKLNPRDFALLSSESREWEILMSTAAPSADD
jgi:hypothetical protein